ncbi:type II secretion system F family protein [Janibacter limosus]|uniref:type II secretion system F family protein n=1 Tax=Janibacter limosus TaxID=53458 RepID=UPI000A004669|nr:type II secretion system F family protein [Janibacter limosus]
MSPLVMAMAISAVVGIAIALVVAGLTPSRPDLAAAVERMRPQTLRSARAPDVGPTDRTRTESIGAWARHRADRYPVLRAPMEDLELLQVPVEEHYGKKAIASGAALVGCTLLPMVMGFGFIIPFGIGLAFAAFAWFVPDLTVRDRAKDSREDFAYAAVSYLRLVAIARRAGLGLVASLDSAAHKSDSWMFVRIREELRLARWSGETSWDALDRLAGRTKVPELKEVADIIRLANDSGASVSDNLLARAASMRDRLLTREQTAANAATSSMGIPLAVLAVLFLIAMLVPAAMQLSPG